jgi:hypothetical protein
MKEQKDIEKIKKQVIDKLYKYGMSELSDEEIEVLKNMDDIEIFTISPFKKQKIELKENQYILIEIKDVRLVKNRWEKDVCVVEDNERFMFIPSRYFEILSKLKGQVVMILRKKDRVVSTQKRKFVVSDYEFIKFK